MTSRHGLWLMADGIWKTARPFAIAISLQPLAMSVACSPGGPASKSAARNLVLITVDTLRADHVGAYGYTRARTPALDDESRSWLMADS